MKLLKKTYHFFSALMLLLFLSSIVLPVSVSAATLFCDMEMEAMAQPHKTHDYTCCDFHEEAPETQAMHSSSSSSNSCGYQQVCDEAVSSDQTEKEAIPQFAKSLIAALVFTDIFIGDTDDTVRYKLISDTAKYHKKEPLFLLNSAFLN